MELRKKALRQIDICIRNYVELFQFGHFNLLEREYHNTFGIIEGYFRIDLISLSEYEKYTVLINQLYVDFSQSLMKVRFYI